MISGQLEHVAELRNKEWNIKEKLKITSTAETRHQAVRLLLLDMLGKWEREVEKPEDESLPDDMIFELEELIAKYAIELGCEVDINGSSLSKLVNNVRTDITSINNITEWIAEIGGMKTVEGIVLGKVNDELMEIVHLYWSRILCKRNG